jgi:peroxiredoxin Q/BCP
MKIILLAFVIGIGAFVAYKTITPEIGLHEGEQAPDFSLLDSEGVSRSLKDFQGNAVVLYFFPKAGTPGCTAQACSLRDSYAPFKEQNSIIFGVSYDSVEQLADFKVKHHLPFYLLSDAKKEVAAKYGASRPFFSNVAPHRITFIIDEQGKIIKVMPHVTVDTHTQEILDFIKQRSKA